MTKWSAQEFLRPVLKEAARLGTVTTKKSFLGGTVIWINKVKIGGVIKDKHGFLFQLKPTKKGEMILQEYAKHPEHLGKSDSSFTFKSMDDLPFLTELIQATFEELKR